MVLITELPRQQLCDFIAEPKSATYAAAAARVASKSPQSKNYLFERAPFRYEDQYFGEIVDMGMETVWYQGIPVWGMVYRGGVQEEYTHLKPALFSFLKEALRHPVANFPTRGPEEYRRGKLVYLNRPEGDMSAFHGSETILMDGEPACYRRYVGGLILGQHNPKMRLL